jgi:hypothetical protein
MTKKANSYVTIYVFLLTLSGFMYVFQMGEGVGLSEVSFLFLYLQSTNSRGDLTHPL